MYTAKIFIVAFVCLTAYASAGEPSSSPEINVQQNSTQGVPNYNLKPGSPATLDCTHLNEDVTFYRRFRKTNETSDVSESAKFENNKLVFENLTREDLAYDYVCVSVLNETNKQEFNAHPYIHMDGVSQSDFVSHFKKLEGSFVSLKFIDCNNCHCFKDGQEEKLEHSDKFNIHATIFKINNIDTSDTGNYSCISKNEFGEDSIYFTIDVYSRLSLSVAGPIVGSFVLAVVLIVVVYIIEKKTKSN